MVAGDITAQPKQGRQVAQMSSLCILLCLCFNHSINQSFGSLLCLSPIRVLSDKVYYDCKYFRSKLECIITASHFRTSLPGLRRHLSNGRLAALAVNIILWWKLLLAKKHCSLLGQGIDYNHKRFYDTGSRGLYNEKIMAS